MMSDIVKVAIIAAIAPTLLGLAAFINSLRNSKKIDTVHELINSRMTELLSRTKEVSTEKGIKEGRAQIKEEIKRENDQ